VAAWVLAASGIAKPCFAGDPTPEMPDTSTAEVQRCVEAHDNARVLMLEEKWLEAREGMNRCQDAVCPLAIRSDCAAWLEEVARILPTLLVVVERDDDGKAPVELELDGRRLELPNPPRPIEVLPGTHLLRVNLVPYPQVERVVVLNKGDKNHVVRVQFTHERQPLPVVAPSQPAPKAAPSRPIPVTTYALAGGALAAFATSGIFLASALTSRNDALDRCAPVCEDSVKNSIDARLLAADIFGAAGIVLGGFAVYTFVTRPTVETIDGAAFTPKLEVSRGGGTLSVEGHF
jgi:hypothetical protein